jgi:hypothetical protein
VSKDLRHLDADEMRDARAVMMMTGMSAASV